MWINILSQTKQIINKILLCVYVLAVSQTNEISNRTTKQLKTITYYVFMIATYMMLLKTSNVCVWVSNTNVISCIHCTYSYNVTKYFHSIFI